jgi:hypothetical protein
MKPTRVLRSDTQNIKNKVISIRVSPVEIEILKRWASDEKLPVSELVRQCVFSMEKAQREQDAAQAQEIEDCEHGDYDHGICGHCGSDQTEWLAGIAEDRFEGDR